MTNTCDDNRFQLIEKYKTEIVAATNIEDCKDEMNVIDSILFRFWQIGWLDKLEKPSVQQGVNCYLEGPCPYQNENIDVKDEEQWILCSERLPEKPDTYIATLDYGKQGLGVGQRYYYDEYLGWNDDCVIAWMPLPEPYRKEAAE